MPMYNYKCPKCGHKFEDRAGMNDPNPPCPNTIEDKPCATTVEKDFNWGKSPSVQFNGGGWAKDGYSK